MTMTARVSTGPILHDRDFRRVQKHLYEHAGIHLSDGKKPLVASRLLSRLKASGLSTYADYIDHTLDNPESAEHQALIDSLTTNETYFFREPEHFTFLEQLLAEHRNKKHWRIWSGASSTGEEIYSLAMVLADHLGLNGQWEVVGTDLSHKVIAEAVRGHYPMSRHEGISLQRLKRYCLKGVGPQEGTLLIDDALKRHVRFSIRNLMQSTRSEERYDIIFLRNVMIYFNNASKQTVLNNVLRQLKVGGYFFISHTESLMNTTHRLEPVKSSIYRLTE
ncbi:CheR family methyltransferase [Reinekea blandensis]|uniref:Chemotaxis protein methyltransferase n=1 Tax=Reinekea blandensis MED297 TaxID=314283 RepID=A4BD14_9GAMM|nr:protein-glutamate O-methyltransferase CheR [Reinekea blandensis]EAR10096.1 chemotaxis protein methyltransferase CheR [Reinekea sp. MED297] [Reinekea blandensis MED297]